MYQPTPTELEEMGFEVRIDWTYVLTWTPNFYFYVDENKFFVTWFQIYPSSREHLKQIILAFKPQK